jgi:hypothetical protein
MASIEELGRAYKIYLSKVTEGKELLKDIPYLYAHKELTKCYDMIHELKGQGYTYEDMGRALGNSSHSVVYSILRAKNRLVAIANSLSYLVRIARMIQKDLGISPTVLYSQENTEEIIELESEPDPVYRLVGNEVVVTKLDEVFRFPLNEDRTDIKIDTSRKYPKWMHQLWSDKKFNDFVRSGNGQD